MTRARTKSSLEIAAERAGTAYMLILCDLHTRRCEDDLSAEDVAELRSAQRQAHGALMELAELSRRLDRRAKRRGRKAA